MPISRDEIIQKLMSMSQEERDHIQEILSLLVDCHENGSGQAVMVFTKTGADSVELITMNVYDEEALSLLYSSADMIRFDTQIDAPPREKFN